MTPAWGVAGLDAEYRRVDKKVKAECPGGNVQAVERFSNGETVNEIVCLETGEWDRQFDHCASKYFFGLLRKKKYKYSFTSNFIMKN